MNCHTHGCIAHSLSYEHNMQQMVDVKKVQVMEYESAFEKVTGENNIQQVINTANPIYKSMQGKYFIGTTHVLYPGQNINAWGVLINPSGSGVNLYVSTFAVSNYGAIPFKPF